MSILAIVAKQKRVRLRERTKAGLARAKSKGKQLGQPSKSQTGSEQIWRLKGGV